ncbi:MAG TPA: CPBP family intramembrane glutamic endopeptidase [Ktedonobacteraceae bacterium]
MHIKRSMQRHPLVTYFGLAYLLSYGGFVVLVGPKLLRGQPMQPTDAFILFPMIVVGVCLAGIALTGITGGARGLRDLFSRIGRWRVGTRWYAVALLTAPVLILVVLLIFRSLISPVFAPNLLLLGIPFGLLPGLFEEVGWTGYAFPRMWVKRSPLSASLFLGVLWGLWHAPVVDYLGAATPHGVYWAPFFLAFIAILTAMRVLIAWVYSNTNSVLLAQLMHASSTGFLIILSPSHVSPGQETLWYAVYATVLWLVVALIVMRYGTNLVRRPMEVQVRESAFN